MGQQNHKTSKHTVLKKKIHNSLLLLLIGVFGLVATGCSNKNPSAAKKSEVRVWRINQDIDSFRDIIKDFQKENASTTVTYKKKTPDNYEFRALKSLAARTGPDIWSIPNDWLGDYQDQIVPLPDNYFWATDAKSGKGAVESVKELYAPGIVEQIVSVDGKQVYGLPTNVDTLQLYLNPELFDEAYNDFRKSLGSSPKDEVTQPVKQLLSKRPPVTWSDMVQQVKYLTKRNGTAITRSAIALGTADNVPNSNEILQLLMYQNDTKVVSDDHTNPLFHVPQTTPSGGQVLPGERALDFFTSFSDPNKETYSWNPSMPQALDAFGRGQVAMVIAYSDFGKQLKIKYPRFHPDVYAVPQISAAQKPVNLISFSVETVTKVANNQSAAFAFLKTYANESVTRNLASEQKLFSPFIKTLQNRSDAFQSNQILTGKSTFKLNHPQFDASFRQMIVDVSQNGVGVSEAVKGAADKIDTLLKPATD